MSRNAHFADGRDEAYVRNMPCPSCGTKIHPSMFHVHKAAKHPPDPDHAARHEAWKKSLNR